MKKLARWCWQGFTSMERQAHDLRQSLLVVFGSTEIGLAAVKQDLMWEEIELLTLECARLMIELGATPRQGQMLADIVGRIPNYVAEKHVAEWEQIFAAARLANEKAKAAPAEAGSVCEPMDTQRGCAVTLLNFKVRDQQASRN